MSAIAYPCGIISVPAHSRTSMRYEVQVEQGINLVTKKVGQQAAYVPSSGIGIEQVELAAGKSFISPAVTSVCVMTDTPVQVTVVSGTVTMTFVVNSVLVLDDNYSSVTVSNPNAAPSTIVAHVSVFYTM